MPEIGLGGVARRPAEHQPRQALAFGHRRLRYHLHERRARGAAHLHSGLDRLVAPPRRHLQ
jgi:hypothetical protein